MVLKPKHYAFHASDPAKLPRSRRSLVGRGFPDSYPPEDESLLLGFPVSVPALSASFQSAISENSSLRCCLRITRCRT
ncbi:hypothetical protein SBA6_300018 [Candidatus Sulfopaludibacter sp. SbA6]|nr:hypothetical protein SBA6_300018 [Candidatus Sulfopaludibacter sp. SbA6]